MLFKDIRIMLWGVYFEKSYEAVRNLSSFNSEAMATAWRNEEGVKTALSHTPVMNCIVALSWVIAFTSLFLIAPAQNSLITIIRTSVVGFWVALETTLVWYSLKRLQNNYNENFFKISYRLLTCNFSHNEKESIPLKLKAINDAMNYSFVWNSFLVQFIVFIIEMSHAFIIWVMKLPYTSSKALYGYGKKTKDQIFHERIKALVSLELQKGELTEVKDQGKIEMTE